MSHHIEKQSKLEISINSRERESTRILQLKTETPTVLDCSRNFMKGVIETIKKQTLCGFHYFTPKQNFYEQQRFLKFEELSERLNKKR